MSQRNKHTVAKSVSAHLFLANNVITTVAPGTVIMVFGQTFSPSETMRAEPSDLDLSQRVDMIESGDTLWGRITSKRVRVPSKDLEMMQFGRTWAVVVALSGVIAGFAIGLFSFWADPIQAQDEETWSWHLPDFPPESSRRIGSSVRRPGWRWRRS